MDFIKPTNNNYNAPDDAPVELQSKSSAMPIAVVIAGIAIAIAVFATRSDNAQNVGKNSPSDQKSAVLGGNIPQQEVAKNIDSIVPISADDHILGSPDALIYLIEYSDTECPFCKDMHITMQKVMKTYGVRGEVAWVYRHYPIERLHPRALKEAEATECATELGGNEMFWEYIDELFRVTPSNNNLDPSALSVIALTVGLDVNEFESCLNSGKYKTKVAEHISHLKGKNITGTPYTYLVMGDQVVGLPGSTPYENISSLLDMVLNRLGQKLSL
jgi:protein-disulfide isomerase